MCVVLLLIFMLAPVASAEPAAVPEPAPIEHYVTESTPTATTPPAPEERDPEA